jgi:hypothetical protein
MRNEVSRCHLAAEDERYRAGEKAQRYQQAADNFNHPRHAEE